MEYSFDFFEKEDKHFFAGLFNTAQNNFDLSLTELAKRINTSAKEKLAVIDNAFNDNVTLFDFENNFNYLSESLVFLKRAQSFIANKNKKEGCAIIFRDYFKDFLKRLYKTIRNHRNFYTHYNHDEVFIDKDIFEFLNYVLFNSANRVKDDRAKLDDVKKRLYREANFKEDFEQVFQAKNELNVINGKDPIKAKDKLNFVINKMFHFFIYDDKQTSTLKNSVNCSDEEHKITESGYIQLLALFLNKRQINVLFDNVKYWKNEEDTGLQKIIVRWVYTYESYKIINRLFKSDYDNDALLLQMVSELSKCPKNLYPLLSTENKNEFIESVNIYLKENTTFQDKDHLVSHEVIRKRYEDKFPYFAIRFLDEFANFPKLRFHVNMGKFNHDRRTKKFKSISTNTERNILERLTVFEKLSVATAKKNEYFKNSGSEKVIDWVEYPRPKYQFFNNNIGIWLEDNSLGKWEVQKERKVNKLTKHDILNKLGLKDALKKPVAYLSFNELPALLYNLLIKKDTPEAIEKQITTKINERRRYISGLNDDSDPKENKVSKKVLQILRSAGQLDYDRLKVNLKKEIGIKETENEKERMGNEEERMDVNPLQYIRKNYKTKPKDETILSTSEKGKIATWLSKDIKRFVTTEIKKPWKPHQFSEFQALLSLYDIYKHKLSDYIFKDLNLNIYDDFPFRGINFGKENLYAFYENYMKERKAYISQLINDIDQGNYSDALLQPFNKNKFFIKTIEAYKKSYLRHPMMLPRGIFDDKHTASKEKDKTMFADWFAISRNLENAQQFYWYTKYYPISDEVKNTVKPGKGIKQQYLPMATKEHQKEIYKNETALRKTMRNDYYSLQMVKYIFKKSNEVDNKTFENITLKDFYLTKAEKKDIRKAAESQSSKQKGDISKPVFNEDYILSKRVQIGLLDNKISGNVALKDSSRYKKLSQDQKVIQLTAYFDKTWTFEEVINEISDYEHIRAKVFFKTVHKLEKKIEAKASEENCTDQLYWVHKNSNGEEDKIPNFNYYLNYYFLKNKSQKKEFAAIDMKKEDISNVKNEFKPLFLLVQIRNKFAHNQLLSKSGFDYLNKKIPMEENERVASYLNRIFSILVEETIKSKTGNYVF